MKILINPAALKSSAIFLILTAALTVFIVESTKQNISYILAWVLAINMVIITVMAKDKFSAIIKFGRTPEGTLLWLAFLGAFPGLFLSRTLFNHKTSKAEFIRPMWILLILQVTAVLYYFVKISNSF